MILEYVPLLQIERDLYRIERGPERFGAYLRTALVDAAGGGCTNRYTNDYTHRCAGAPLRRRGWITAPAWTGEAPSAARLGQEAAAAIHRAAYILRHAASLAEVLAQEGYAMALAGCREPRYDAEELAYTRQAVRRYLQHRDRPTVMAFLYGDHAARSLEYEPVGRVDFAGLALARAAYPA